MAIGTSSDGFAAIASLAEFDKHSGNRLERLLFNHRLLVVGLCLLLTACFALSATQLRLNASFLKTIPASHPFILNYLKHADDLKGSANAVRIAVAVKGEGDIFSADYMETLRQINDDLYLVPGVDRAFMKSLWTPLTRWQGVTEEGFDGGPVGLNTVAVAVSLCSPAVRTEHESEVRCEVHTPTAARITCRSPAIDTIIGNIGADLHLRPGTGYA